jgi:hypothetical protein
VSKPAQSFMDPLVAAVVPRLTGDITLSTLLGSGARVYNRVPKNAPTPYIRVSVNTERAWNWIGGQRGSSVVLQTQIASRYAGEMETSQVVSRLRALLDGWRTTLTGATHRSELTFDQALPAFDEDVDGVMVTYRTVLWTMAVV